jgi:hypothetical protein
VETLRRCTGAISPDDEDFIRNQSITLAAAKHRPGKSVLPKSVYGHIGWGTLKIAFDGMRPVREGSSSDASVPWIASYWEVLLTPGDDEESNDWLDMEGNTVGAAKVLDDNECPFLVFDWSHPPGCHSSWSGYYLGKRVVEGKEWRLSDEERGRLGIGCTFKSVEKSAKEGSPGVYSEDSEEEEYSRVYEYVDPDQEDKDEEESSEEEAPPEDVGEKRKASDSETGANKRRRA